MPRKKSETHSELAARIGKRIKILLERDHVSQRYLADYIGITAQSVNFYVNGVTVPDIDALIKMAQFFNVSTDYLLGLSDVQTASVEEQAIFEYTGLSEESIKALHYIRNAPLNSLVYDIAVPGLFFINRGLEHYYNNLKSLEYNLLITEYLNTVEPVFSPLESWVTGTEDPKEIKIGNKKARKDDIYRELCFSRFKYLLDDIAEIDGTFAETMKETEKLLTEEYERQENLPDPEESEL